MAHRPHTGLTPASAGRTYVRPSPSLWRWAYPRECGENHNRVVGCLQEHGLPPRVRGERRSRRFDPRVARLTPASAGRTRRLASSRQTPKAYPRECGENPSGIWPNERFPGLPPRVRGEPSSSMTNTSVSRLTPASAGRTERCESFRLDPSAYPRECGENLVSSSDPPPKPGLPPRVRGERLSAPTHPSASGLTPASAGRTESWTSSPNRPRAYPRECGENGPRWQQLSA